MSVAVFPTMLRIIVALIVSLNFVLVAQSADIGGWMQEQRKQDKAVDPCVEMSVDSLEAGYEITMADVSAALEKQDMKDFKFIAGDGVFFRIGWGKYWITSNAKYNGGVPGIGMDVAKWLSDVVHAGATSADTWGTQVIPNNEAACAFCAHSHFFTRHSIVNEANMHLDDLSKDKTYRFTYMYLPMPIAGATGSAGAPLAFR